MTAVGTSIEPARCRRCGTQLAPSLLSCPSCRSLVHANRLTTLAERARRHEVAGRIEDAIADWREVMSLLPADAGQHVAAAAHIEELTRAAPGATAPRDPADSGSALQGGTRGEARDAAVDGHSHTSLAKHGALFGGAALFLWKFKVVLPLLLTKGKLLLAAIPKMGGMFLGLGASLGIYWAAWGWQFALGLIVSIYIHELGHVVAMRLHGIPSSAPMFVPGLGAYVRMHRLPKNAWEDARIGLAGPLAGLGAALLCTAIFLATEHALFGTLATFGAFINLMNLLPVWHLDGARACGAFDRRFRWIAIGVLTAGALLAANAFPLLVAVVFLARMKMPQPDRPDATSLALFAFVTLALCALLTLPVAGIPSR